MGWYRLYIGFVAVLICVINLSFGQGDVPKPTFPDVFQVEVEGIFFGSENLVELDGTIYFDRKNNKAALSYTLQNTTVKTIYNFDDNEIVILQGNGCEVDQISDDPGESLFHFATDESGKKLISSAETVLYFTDSTLDVEGEATFPSYVYKAKVNIDLLERENCTVNHIFTKPEVKVPDCDSFNCSPVLMTIKVNCPSFVREGSDEEEGEVEESLEHLYNFYRFKPRISDMGVFQPPAGVYCNLSNPTAFPGLPDYFSFSYDFQEDAKDFLANSGVLTTHKKVWYDSKLNLIRVDEFEDNGMLVSSRIFDLNGETAYTIVTNLADCEEGAIVEDVDLSELTRLPKLLFKTDLTPGDAVYIGKKKAHGLLYDVWTASTSNPETDSLRIEEFFYRTVLDGAKSQKLLSHVDVYMYGRNSNELNLELNVNAYYSINNFRSKPKEWEAFDVSDCFDHDRKKAFRLKVSGPPIIRNSLPYENLLEALYMNLVEVTTVSIIRISKLTGIQDGNNITEFKGWILDKPMSSGSKTKNFEPDMQKAYEMVKNAAAYGKLDIKFKKADEEVLYKITMMDDSGNIVPIKPEDPEKTMPGWAVATVVLSSLAGVTVLGGGGYYAYRKRKQNNTLYESRVQMERIA